MKTLLGPPCSFRWFLGAAAGFSAIMLTGVWIHHFLCVRVPGIPCITTWPIGVVFPRTPPDIGYPNALHLAIGVASALLLGIGLLVLERTGFRPFLAGLLGFALVLATTLTHGWQFGLVRAAAGMGNMPQDYYQDALNISDPAEFVQEFDQRQAELSIHSRTHPPGAVLAFFYLQRLLGDPAAIAIAIAFVATAFSVLFIGKILSAVHPTETVGRTLFLFLLVPAVQVYYAASVDALIAPLVVGACAFLFAKPRVWFVVSFLCLTLALFLSYGTLFVVPVILAFDSWRSRRPWRALLLIGLVVGAYLALDAFLGFDYLRSFRVAASLENPDGFRLLSTPGEYLMTRAEDVGEIILFLGPFLSALVLSGLRPRGAIGGLTALSLLAIASFGALLIMGAYRTGETARAALFIYPFLMLPVAQELGSLGSGNSKYRSLAALVFLQAVLMQLVGDFWW
jgi:hypothetical protein